ncbi:hypothetical protein BU23DRAFT_564394 [Bimuria novae-zelandiae CBS 107.79]|uniref:Uncharacterized protein n=1 Tax=Bimuria novae-zelandiae CBS 107.79 TaxID=1447943 RepID=A0A6A5VY97_9PLEO|nr:hypothetical protein BU23DRAFT_564394 [Bimuria novae-zelandiae CBS 107.79]
MKGVQYVAPSKCVSSRLQPQPQHLLAEQQGNGRGRGTEVCAFIGRKMISRLAADTAKHFQSASWLVPGISASPVDAVFVLSRNSRHTLGIAGTTTKDAVMLSDCDWHRSLNRPHWGQAAKIAKRAALGAPCAIGWPPLAAVEKCGDAAGDKLKPYTQARLGKGEQSVETEGVCVRATQGATEVLVEPGRILRHPGTLRRAG